MGELPMAIGSFSEIVFTIRVSGRIPRRTSHVCRCTRVHICYCETSIDLGVVPTEYRVVERHQNLVAPTTDRNGSFIITAIRTLVAEQRLDRDRRVRGDLRRARDGGAV
jgi:hypothetical protein